MNRIGECQACKNLMLFPVSAEEVSCPHCWTVAAPRPIADDLSSVSSVSTVSVTQALVGGVVSAFGLALGLYIFSLLAGTMGLPGVETMRLVKR